MTNRRLFVVGLVLALGVAVVLAQFASSSPDGLEYVAEQEGFLETAGDHDLAEVPLANYGETLTSNGWANTAVAGLAGTLATLAIGSGVFWLARKTNGDDPESAST
ncbi:MAG: PDGLE domain-containing protein [Actinomycetota bacterium]|nr:PDGLE domain-containing protein [Actinomycetota bacterium]